GIEIPFFQWMLIGVPVAGALFLFTFTVLHLFCPAGGARLEGTRAMLAEEKARLGVWSTGERSTLAAFAITVLLWITPGIVALIWGESSAMYRAMNRSMPEAVAALIGASLLFLLPAGAGRRAMT